MASSVTGYLRFPTIAGDTMVFVAEDAIWILDGPQASPARRLTGREGRATRPLLSPDGTSLAFVTTMAGHPEVYAMPARGGTPVRVTFWGGDPLPCGWLPDGRLVVATAAHSPFRSQTYLYAYAVSVDGSDGTPEPLPYGPGNAIAYAPSGAVALGRHASDSARWKRYRGGTAGQIWVDAEASGHFRRLPLPNGNPGRPMWIGERLYFLSDHEGVGNLYSCAPDGTGIRRHTDHETYYARNAQSDGKRIVYHAGGDLYLYDPLRDVSEEVPVELGSVFAGRAPHSVQTEKFLTSVALHPKGHKLALVTRGQTFALGAFEGPSVPLRDPDEVAPADSETALLYPHGDREGKRLPRPSVRHRLVVWLDDGRRVALVSDSGGEEALEVYDSETGRREMRLGAGELGEVLELSASPKGSHVALSTNRMALWVADLSQGTLKVKDTSEFAEVHDLNWSPDGRYLAYSWAETRRTRAIRLFSLADGEAHTITRPLSEDFSPAFDPTGHFLFFLSRRTFDPVWDTLRFDMGFPRSVRPYVLTLEAGARSLLTPDPWPLGGEATAQGGPGDTPGVGAPVASGGGSPGAQGEVTCRVDLPGILERVEALPVPEDRYEHLTATADRVYYLARPIEGTLNETLGGEEEPNLTLKWFDLKELREETVLGGLSDYELSRDGKILALRLGHRLRLVKAGEKVDEHPQDPTPGRRSGFVDLGRVRVLVDPHREWAQMLREAHRLMREHFWTADMSGMDWEAVYERYAALLGRLSVRSELSDLIWEMQGELGTSHAYELGGDYGETPADKGGTLAAEFRWSDADRGYQVTHVVEGDTFVEGEDSPLRAPGVDVREGDVLLSVNGERLTRLRAPEAALAHLAGTQVVLGLGGPRGERSATVRVIASDRRARYREWTERNRAFVHARSGGRVGYVHVPDMGPHGYAEFYRGYLTEVEHDALLVDVRKNGGGNVSQLLLQTLLRRPVGVDVPRWGKPETYPSDAPRGPVVALTDEDAGSDGDIFSHAFKLLGIGPLVGTRTWGGVIGISGQARLVDGALVTEPEYAFWFQDVGWGVENRGTDPDVPVENPPEDLATGRDAQLERAVDEALSLLSTKGVWNPSLDARPPKVPGPLPPR